MKAEFLAGIGIGMLLLPTPATAAAQDCEQVVKELNTLSATIQRDADGYWAARRTFIESRTSKARNAAEATRVTRLGDAARSRSAAAKSSVPAALKNFAALAETAKTQKCLPPEKLRPLREATFNRARAVNFDQVPTSPSTEGAPAVQKPPRMPMR